MRKRFFPLFLLFLGCSACATLPREPYPAPPPEDLLARLLARSQEIRGLKGLARVRVSAPGKKFTTQEVVFARRPGFLRLETLSPLGTPVFYLVAADRDLFLYHPGENRFYRGSADARGLSEFLPAGLDPEEVAALLLGGFPLFAPAESAVRYEARDGRWFLTLRGGSGFGDQVLGIDPRSGEVVSAEYSLRGLARRLSFADHRPASGFSFPHRIDFEAPAARTELTVEYQEVTLNPEWEEGDFRLPVPRGAQVVPLE
jgi:outer membrane lipoprotein-sorting protein